MSTEGLNLSDGQSPEDAPMLFAPLVLFEPNLEDSGHALRPTAIDRKELRMEGPTAKSRNLVNLAISKDENWGKISTDHSTVHNSLSHKLSQEPKLPLDAIDLLLLGRLAERNGEESMGCIDVCYSR